MNKRIFYKLIDKGVITDTIYSTIPAYFFSLAKSKSAKIVEKGVVGTNEQILYYLRNTLNITKCLPKLGRNNTRIEIMGNEELSLENQLNNIDEGMGLIFYMEFKNKSNFIESEDDIPEATIELKSLPVKII